MATASKRCVAVSSTDTAPALIALDAKVKLLGVSGEREIPVAALYQNDGIDYLSRTPDEILPAIEIPQNRFKSTCWKLRRRGAFDFPVLGVAAAARMTPDGVVEELRIALGASASRPFLIEKINDKVKGKKLSDDLIAEVSSMVASRAKPLDNTDLDLYWRKEVADDFAGYALRELRGDDMREIRLRTARYQPG